MNTARRLFLKQGVALSLALASRPLTPALSLSVPSDLAGYDALGLADLVRKKKVSPLELVDDAIRRIGRLNPTLNIVLTKSFDFDLARQHAKSVAADGPFAGVPFLLKNIVQYRDANIDEGSRLLAAIIAKNGRLFRENSQFVNAVERSGLIVTGVTNCPEFGLVETTEPVLYGAAHNPWNTAYTTGGSSGGSAAAVAAGIVPMAHANDGGGSIRIPACHCGVFGLKPSRGRELQAVPAIQALPDPINIISDLCVSRSVRDSAAFLNAVENKNNPKLPPVGFVEGPSKRRLRIALALEVQGKKPDPEVEQAIKASARLCESLGHKVEETQVPVDAADLSEAFLGFWAAQTVGLDFLVKTLGPDVKREDLLEPFTIGLMEMGKKLGAQAAAARATKSFTDAAVRLEGFFKRYDVMLSPILRIPAFKLGYHDPKQDFQKLLTKLLDEVLYTPLHNACGTPAMSVPLHWTKDGLPVGSQFAAWRGGEATLLALAYELEAAQPWTKRRPVVFA
jgi:amidase